jgi:mannan endo-1,6-alpha-mannosidase
MFWGLAAITASETGFPEIQGKPTWTSLARAVFNMQIHRWDTSSCDGAINWQIHLWQEGNTLRNAISNGGLFQLAARLGHFTKNETYFMFAEQIWDWSVNSPLIQPGQDWLVADSTLGDNNCADSDHMQWTYNYGSYLAGCAFMYNSVRGPDRTLISASLHANSITRPVKKNGSTPRRDSLAVRRSSFF